MTSAACQAGTLLMQQATQATYALGQAMVVMPLMLSCGSVPSLLASQFNASQRCTAFCLSYSLAVALVGGSAPLIGSWLLDERHWSWGPAVDTLLWLPACLWALDRQRHARVPG